MVTREGNCVDVVNSREMSEFVIARIPRGCGVRMRFQRDSVPSLISVATLSAAGYKSFLLWVSNMKR